MATKKLKFKPMAKKDIFDNGLKLGLDKAWLTQLLAQVGPALASMLIKILLERQLTPKAAGGGLVGSIGGDLLKGIIVDFITNSRDSVLEWIEDGEDALYDAIVALAASKSAGAASLLALYKDQVTAFDDTITANLVDKVIAALKAQQ